MPAALSTPPRSRSSPWELNVPEYKLYSIGHDGHIEKRHDCNAPDDLAALDKARALCGPHEIEVWNGARFVARLAADGSASTVTPKGVR